MSQYSICGKDQPSDINRPKEDLAWRHSVFGGDRLGRGAVLFTGPDGIRDHHTSVNGEHRYVGEGAMSVEGSSEVDYLWRARQMPHPRPKSHCVGEVGWGIPAYADWQPASSGRQIALGEFRQAVEDRNTHLMLNAWYPAPRSGACVAGPQPRGIMAPNEQNTNSGSGESTFSLKSQKSSHN